MTLLNYYSILMPNASRTPNESTVHHLHFAGIA